MACLGVNAGDCSGHCTALASHAMKYSALLPSLAAALTFSLAVPAAAQDTSAATAACGGGFSDFIEGLRREALSLGHDPKQVDAFLASAQIDEKVLAADRKQGVFRKGFVDFAAMMISDERLATAKAKARSEAKTLAQAEAEYGIPAGILMAFWAFETDFGRIQGDFNTRNALITLAHDCRRPALFRPQIMAAIALYSHGDFPLETTGAWAGEIGMVQMLPKDIIERGIDGDGDGLVSLKTSVADALLSGANMLRHHGWRPGEPWLLEVTLPDDFDWSETGLARQKPVSEWQALGVHSDAAPSGDLAASVLLPQGRKGPAFLAFANYRSLFEWNQSFTYVTTAAYFAGLVEGAAPMQSGNPDPVLPLEAMKALQLKLTALGHDVGEADGILGAGTREAVQKEQHRLGLPADAWPDRRLLDLL